MNRIEIPVSGNAPSPAAVTQGGKAGAKSETKLDEAFQKLIKKLNSELAKGKDTPDGGPAEETPVSGKRHAKAHGPKTEIQPDEDRGPEAKNGRDVKSGAEQTGELPLLPDAGQIAEASDKPAPGLPELLQAFPPKSDGKPQEAGNERTNRSAAHVVSVRPGSTSAAQNGPDLPVDTKSEAAGKNPFAALTELLAKENIGSEPETVELDTPIKTPNITVVSRETHFEPIVRAQPAQQVANAIVANMGTETTANTAAIDPRDLDNLSLRKASDGPLKILHIKLEPDNLGEVSVKMRLVGESLEIRLETSRAETADLLTRDKDMLHRLLRTSGYIADVVTIQAVDSSSSSQSPNGQSNPNGGAAGQSSTMSQNGDQPDSRHQGEQTASAPDSLTSSETSHDDAARASDGDLYL